MRLLVVSSTGYSSIEAAFDDIIQAVDHNSAWVAKAERMKEVVAVLAQHPEPGVLWLFRSLLDLVVCMSDDYADGIVRISANIHKFTIISSRSQIRPWLLGPTDEQEIQTAEAVGAVIVAHYQHYIQLFGMPSVS